MCCERRLWYSWGSSGGGGGTDDVRRRITIDARTRRDATRRDATRRDARLGPARRVRPSPTSVCRPKLTYRDERRTFTPLPLHQPFGTCILESRSPVRRLGLRLGVRAMVCD